eukprot:1888655-Pyramimonas_sp.AAC.1
MENRADWCDGKGGLLKHETAGLVKLAKISNHYALACWIKVHDDMGESRREMTTLAPVSAVAATARPEEEDADGDAVQRALAGRPR